jgi:hypothetical protein
MIEKLVSPFIMFGFVKLPKYRRFEFQPRFYDPEKEARQNRLRELKAQNPEFWQEVENESREAEASELWEKEKAENYAQNSRLRGSFRAARAARSSQKKQGSLSEGLLPLFTLVAMGLSLWGMMTDSAENFYHYILLLGVGFVAFVWLRVRSSLR